ncbi:MAG: rod shape-determining protein RodA [bacterium]
MTGLLRKFLDIDWILFFSAIFMAVAGLVTMGSFGNSTNYFSRQIIWILISVVVFFILSLFDYRFLKRTGVVVTIFASCATLLLALFVVGHISKGAQSWFSFGGVSLQPADLVKLAIVILLAKYFSKRHIEIANIRHIFVSGFYVFIVFVLVLLQPDFGSALIIFLIWLGLILLSGISKKHLLAVFILGSLAFGALWGFVLQDYQKSRVINFIHPLADIRGTGYNAYQSTIAVGSGQLTGKGIGYGTQSKLSFLPEYQTDFIFPAYAEEWGFLGVLLLFSLFGILLWRIIRIAYYGATNFEILFGCGIAIMFVSHFLVNVGMSIGIMPVTGITFPFMSYGGTNLLTSFVGLGILMGMRRYRRTAHKEMMKNEFLGI